MNKKSIKSDLAVLDRLADAAIDYSDIPALGGDFFRRATAPWPPDKRQLMIRLDTDVVDWLKANGRGYQTHQPDFACGDGRKFHGFNRSRP